MLRTFTVTDTNKAREIKKTMAVMAAATFHKQG
jgi:hypothetical protein